MTLPGHVAVIMDGNGRWARARHLPRVEGHRQGVRTLRRIVEAALRSGIRHFTVFAFSSENWLRPADEVRTLMETFSVALKREARPLAEAGIRLHIVGDMTAFPGELLDTVRETERVSEAASAMTLNICINYGGRWDVVQAARSLAARGEAITEQALESALSMPWAGPVDLLVRTGGERRLSNFLLWQASYAELWFTDVLWPDFGKEDLEMALQWYSGRERRFGKTSEQVKEESPDA